jgi:hypothetical protein
MDLYLQPRSRTRWASFENPLAVKGGAGKTNHAWKGAASAPLAAGETVVLMDAQGPGVIRRIWLTVRVRTPQMLRSLRVDCYWDGAATPAVSAPLGDLFGAILGQTSAFENELFCSPEGRSFCCYVPMPFRSHAKITLTNESDMLLTHVFYDVNFTLETVPDDALYFHASFRRESPTQLGHDFEILPRVTGRGRYLGAHVGIVTSPQYDGTWWGEGEVKVFLDGDREFPTLCGTGTEDYISTGWGQGVFHQRYHGSLVADKATRQWGMYRYHIPDPVTFDGDCRVTLQQIGGASKEVFLRALEGGAVMQAISTQCLPDPICCIVGSEDKVDLGKLPPDAWINFLRSDDVSAVALFYLDRSENSLPKLPDVNARKPEPARQP